MVAHYITRRPRLGPIDAQVVYPILLFMLHPRPYTAYVFVTAVLALWYLSMKGVDLMMMSRIIRRLIVGNKRSIRSPWRENMRL
jgi:hypothetical protein